MYFFPKTPSVLDMSEPACPILCTSVIEYIMEMHIWVCVGVGRGVKADN